MANTTRECAGNGWFMFRISHPWGCAFWVSQPHGYLWKEIYPALGKLSSGACKWDWSLYKFSLRNVACNLARRWVGECCWIMEGTSSSRGSFPLAPVDKDFLLEGSSRFASLIVCLLCHLYTDNIMSPFLFSFFPSTFYKESAENHFELFWNFGFFCFSAFLLDYVPDIIAKKLSNTSRDWEN